jgi:hypothetical protein
MALDEQQQSSLQLLLQWQQHGCLEALRNNSPAEPVLAHAGGGGAAAAADYYYCLLFEHISCRCCLVGIVIVHVVAEQAPYRSVGQTPVQVTCAGSRVISWSHHVCSFQRCAADLTTSAAAAAAVRAPPFELEVLEGVLMVATGAQQQQQQQQSATGHACNVLIQTVNSSHVLVACCIKLMHTCDRSMASPVFCGLLLLLLLLPGRLDAEVLSVTRRVGELLQKLPRDINPVNLEELRRIKSALVELENKVQYSMKQYSMKQYSMKQYSMKQYSMKQYSMKQYSMKQYSSWWCCAKQYNYRMEACICDAAWVVARLEQCDGLLNCDVYLPHVREDDMMRSFPLLDGGTSSSPGAIVQGF